MPRRMSTSTNWSPISSSSTKSAFGCLLSTPRLLSRLVVPCISLLQLSALEPSCIQTPWVLRTLLVLASAMETIAPTMDTVRLFSILQSKFKLLTQSRSGKSSCTANQFRRWLQCLLVPTSGLQPSGELSDDSLGEPRSAIWRTDVQRYAHAVWWLPQCYCERQSDELRCLLSANIVCFVICLWCRYKWLHATRQLWLEQQRQFWVCLRSV